MAKPAPGDRIIIESKAMGQLLNALKEDSYTTIGPTIEEQAIVYKEIEGTEELPEGWTEEQEKGTYRLKRRGDRAWFGYNVGPHSWKQFLSPPEVRLWSANRDGDGFELNGTDEDLPKYAFIGVRSCDMAAISILDRVFLGEDFTDPVYRDRRENLFIVAINCTEAGSTCFCASMGTGPKCENGYDLALTEIIDEQNHYFITEVGSDRAAEIMDRVQWRVADGPSMSRADKMVAQASESMGRQLETERLRDLLFMNYEHEQWEDIANRCLSCANCTMVCPTCFCHTVEEATDLDGEHAERWRKWDSCFTLEFSYIHGGSVRKSTLSRYRQWMTHKLASWQDQFGTFGCVGCGRCITWCPVGIDITEEAKAIRENSQIPAETIDQPRKS